MHMVVGSPAEDGEVVEKLVGKFFDNRGDPMAAEDSAYEGGMVEV